MVLLAASMEIRPAPPSTRKLPEGRTVKKRTHSQHTGSSVNGRGPRPRTGEHCPVNGWWAPLSNEASAHFITQGSIMPAVKGHPESWRLLAGQPRQALKPSYDFPPRGFTLDTI